MRSSILSCSIAVTLAHGCCLDYWGEVERYESPTELRLDDVVAEGDLVAVGAAGTLIHDGVLVPLDTDASLLAVAQGRWSENVVAVAGAGGTLIVGEGTEWRIVATPTTADLVAVVVRDSWTSSSPEAIAVGDELVVAYDFDKPSARLVTRSDGRPWGSLNGAFLGGPDRVILVGDDGSVWVADDVPIEQAVALELGVDEDLRTGGLHVDDGHYWIIGDRGLALYEDSAGQWFRVDLDTNADFVDFAAGAALTADGELWDPAANRRIAKVPWARGIGYTEAEVGNRDPIEDPDVHIVGDRGRMAMLDGC